MVAINATMETRGTSSKEIKKVIPSCNAKAYDHILCGMAMEGKRPNLEMYAHTSSQKINVPSVPHGSSSITNPLRGEAHWQVRLPESFIIENRVPTSSMVPPI